MVNLAFELVLFAPEGPPTKDGIMDVLIIPRTSQRYHEAIIMGVMIIYHGCHDNFMVVNLAFELVLFAPEGPPTKDGIMDVLIIH